MRERKSFVSTGNAIAFDLADIVKAGLQFLAGYFRRRLNSPMVSISITSMNTSRTPSVSWTNQAKTQDVGGEPSMMRKPSASMGLPTRKY